MTVPPAEMAQRCRLQACLITDRAVAEVLRTIAKHYDAEADGPDPFDLRKVFGQARKT